MFFKSLLTNNDIQVTEGLENFQNVPTRVWFLSLAWLFDITTSNS